jgi:Rrf2 family protein
MMIISRAAEYGLIAVGYIALHQKEGRMTAHVIYEEFNIPPMYLHKILTNLSRAGILLSKRGPLGGQILAREPEKISLLEIIKAIDGSTFDPCDFTDISNEPSLIKMKKISDKADSELKKVLSETTLAEMIKE